MLLSYEASVQATTLFQHMAFKEYVALLPDGSEKLFSRNQVQTLLFSTDIIKHHFIPCTVM